jgi:UDP-N-acetylglucosamine acyltransferase
VISDLALIHPDAKIGHDVEIGPWTSIGADVEIGDGCDIAPHVIIKGPTRIGAGNRIFQFSTVGEDPSDKKFRGESSRLEIGDHNVIREGCTIHRGTANGGGVTRIGSHNLFMPYAHIAHDCLIGSHTIFSNNASASGHAEVGDWAILGGYSGVAQFLKVGAHSFIGAFTYVNMDVPAYITVSGIPAAARNINATGLERRGFSKEAIEAIRKAYKVIYKKGFSLEEALQHLDSMAGNFPEISVLVASVRASTKGIVR